MNILNLLFPPRCVSCGRPGRYLCPKCLPKIKIIEQQVCPVCERPAIDGATHPGCRIRSSLDGLTSFFVYDGPIKKAIKKLKYKFVTDLAEELVILTGAASTNFSIASSHDDSSIPGHSTTANFNEDVAVRRHSKIVGLRPLLVPVPLHWRRLNWRGFNQSEVLGKLMSARLKTRFAPDLLIRKKYTQPQVKLKGKERKENIQDAFIINPRYQKLEIGYWELVIFDDVWTTGATLKTCGQVLKEAGAKKVWGMTLAR